MSRLLIPHCPFSDMLKTRCPAAVAKFSENFRVTWYEPDGTGN